MNGPHDLGGRAGFGPIAPEVGEPVFHVPWERRALGVTLTAAALGHWNLDESRHARESLHPADYYSSSYYEIWIKALEALVIRHGEVTAEELASGKAIAPGRATEKKLLAEQVPGVLASGGPTNRDCTRSAKFAVGAAVRTVNHHVTGHTRLPSFARDKVGVIEAVHDAFVFPDSNAHGHGEQPQWVYTVVFDGQTLWGSESDANLAVSIDAWEPYLVAA